MHVDIIEILFIVNLSELLCEVVLVVDLTLSGSQLVSHMVNHYSHEIFESAFLVHDLHVIFDFGILVCIAVAVVVLIHPVIWWIAEGVSTFCLIILV